ncbi:MAG: MgtC/SapB family protein [Terracidiphilus sp.]
MPPTTLQFIVRLSTALVLGALVGVERQWRQRMAGTRTNALVSAGASAFILGGLLIENDPSAAGRVASYVVSGVGFLGAGVIFKDGANVHGLNTAATIWCSAAIGFLCGFGHLELGLFLVLAVLLTNIVLRPLAYRLHPVLPAAEPTETQYTLDLTCRESDEGHVRSLLLATVSQSKTSLQALHSVDDSAAGMIRLRAELTTPGRENSEVERVALRLCIEPGVTSLSWALVPQSME